MSWLERLWDRVFPVYTHCSVCGEKFDKPQRFFDCHSPQCNMGA